MCHEEQRIQTKPAPKPGLSSQQLKHLSSAFDDLIKACNEIKEIRRLLRAAEKENMLNGKTKDQQEMTKNAEENY